MNKTINFKKKAFTLMETIISITVIAFIGAMTVCNTVASSDLDEKKVRAGSNIFYSTLENAYQTILVTETTGNNITKLKNVDDFENEASGVLKELLTPYLDLSDVNCNVFPNIANVTSTYLNGMNNCGYSLKGFNVGVNLNDESCSSDYQVKDYYQDHADLRIVEKACGYVIYATRKSKGIIGKDFFIIPLGKRGLL